MHAEYCSENLKGRDHLAQLGVDAMLLKWIVTKYGVRMWNGYTCFMTGYSSRQALVNKVMNLRVP
jgi:hypothetical protein